MLEVVMPGIRHGEGKLVATTAYNGCWCYISGFDANGYQKLALPYSSVQVKLGVFPIKKYYFSEDLTDTSDAVDLLKNGDTVVYYDGGEYITDKFVLSTIMLSAYIEGNEGGLTSAYGKKMYRPGISSTAMGSLAASSKKLYLTSSGGITALTKMGYLSGTKPVCQGTDLQVAVLTGVFGASSADAKIRFRMAHSVLGTYNY
jgi:hypothetical protein